MAARHVRGGGAGAAAAATEDGAATASPPMVDYAALRRRRIAANEQKLRDLELGDAAEALRAAAAPPPAPKRRASGRGLKSKRARVEGPRRTSLRARGLGPDGEAAAAGAPDRVPAWEPPVDTHARKEGPLACADVLWEDQEADHAAALTRWLATAEEASPSGSASVSADGGGAGAGKGRGKGKKRAAGGAGGGGGASAGAGRAARALTALRIRGERFVAKVVPQRVFSISVVPTASVLCGVVGDKWGRVGFWRPDLDDEDEQVVVFAPHSRPVPAIAHVAGQPGRIVTCSYDGSVRGLDAEAGVFDEIFADDDQLFHYVDLTPDGRVAYAATRAGSVLQIDLRARGGKAIEFEELHERKVTSVHVNPSRPELLLTASLDRAVRVWDVRKMKTRASKTAGEVVQAMAVTSAFWSPDGTRFVSTCNDNTVRVWTGATAGTPKQQTSIKHNNHTGRWLSNFRTIWDPAAADTLVVGNMARGLDVYAATTGEAAGYLTDAEQLTAVPTLNALHPTLDAIVSSTASGRLYLWR